MNIINVNRRAGVICTSALLDGRERRVVFEQRFRCFVAIRFLKKQYLRANHKTRQFYENRNLE